MDINLLIKKDLIVYDVISGSHAYNLNTPTSDIDKRGIFILPEKEFYSLNNDNNFQVNDQKNDIVYYELKKFGELLIKQNPNIIELLYIDNENVKKINPIFNYFLENRDYFLTKKCYHTFGSYAISQVKKARGLNKKIVNPIPKKRKTPLEFCNVIFNNGKGSMPLLKWLNKWFGESFENEKELMNEIKYFGVSSVPNAENIFYLFYDHSENKNIGFRGIIKEDFSSNSLRLSSIPKGLEPECTFYYNKDGYTQYCRKYKEYWEWKEKRNETRYNDNLKVGAQYDTKNLMHTVRLLKMGIEILSEGKVNVKREDREELLKIRNGEKTYDEIIEYVDSLNNELEIANKNSPLPGSFDINKLNEVIYKIRKDFYKNK
jgi:hypothetical protein